MIHQGLTIYQVALLLPETNEKLNSVTRYTLMQRVMDMSFT